VPLGGNIHEPLAVSLASSGKLIRPAPPRSSPFGADREIAVAIFHGGESDGALIKWLGRVTMNRTSRGGDGLYLA